MVSLIRTTYHHEHHCSNLIKHSFIETKILVICKEEFIPREFGVPMELEFLRSRSAAGAILELVEEREFDLVVLGSRPLCLSPVIERSIDVIFL